MKLKFQHPPADFGRLHEIVARSGRRKANRFCSTSN
jgi:hypothetical protein